MGVENGTRALVLCMHVWHYRRLMYNRLLTLEIVHKASAKTLPFADDAPVELLDKLYEFYEHMLGLSIQGQ